MHRSRISLVVLLALAGGALSGLLLFEHYGVGSASAAVDALCGPEEDSGCETVSESRYSAIGNLSLAALGLTFFGSMAFLGALALVTSESIENAAAALALVLFGVAVVADLVLFGIQTFAIGAFCKLCLGTYGVNVAALVLLWPWSSKAASAVTALVSGEARRMFVVWALGSLVLMVSVVAVERALASTPLPHRASLLGEAIAAPPPAPEPELEPPPEPEPDPTPEPPDAPVPVPEPEPVTVPAADTKKIAALEAQLDKARAEVRQLKELVDNPDKYQAYQMDKATAAFEAEKPEDLGLEGIPFKGPAEAPIRVVEFSDFLCPFCRNLAGALSNFMPQSGGRVAVFYKNYPLDQACNPGLSRTVHDGACEVALGAVCAHEQGKFWAYHDRVFSEPPHSPTIEDVVGIAVAAGLDGDYMRSCLGSAAAKATLDAQIQEAKRLEVRSTPTVFVNGKRLTQIATFLQAIQSEAKRLGLE